METVAYQSGVVSGRRVRTATALLIAVSAIAALALSWLGIRRFSSSSVSPLAHRGVSATVKLGTLDVVIRQSAEVQAVRNTDLVSNVEGMNTIRSIVPEGTFVRVGDVIAEIDSSDIKRKLQTALLEVKKAQNDFTAAKQQRNIQESKNTADLEAANVELRLAQIDLRTYTEGEYPQKLGEATRNLEMARITLKKQEQNLAATRQLFERGFMTGTDLEKAQVDLVTAQNDFEKKTSEHKVLTQYTREKDLADKQNKVAQAEKKVARVQSENASNLAQKVADEQTKEQALVIQQATLEHWQKQFDSCTVRAPTDGMVIYGSSANEYVYRESPIQAGAKIAEQQLLARLPDTTAMKAVAKIPESLAARLRVDPANPMRGTVKLNHSGQVVGANVTSVSVLPDNSMRWLNPDRKEYPVDLTLDRTPAGTKPGASAQIEIVLQHLENVLTVPLASIYSVGGEHFAFVRDGGRVKATPIELGAVNDTSAEISQGLTAGQELLVLEIGQGEKLLQAAGIKPRAIPAPKSPTTAPAPGVTTVAGPTTAPTVPVAPTSRPAQVVVVPANP